MVWIIRLDGTGRDWTGRDWTRRDWTGRGRTGPDYVWDAMFEAKFKDIQKATNNFAKDNIVKMGGLGEVYKGKLLRPEGLITYAFIRVDTSGEPALSGKKRIMLIRLKNENISTIVGYCAESAKMDVHIYEFHSRRSLDLYLSSAELTWLKRLKICLGGARGLNYLHGEDVIHRNINSTYILLDDNWQAKIVYKVDWIIRTEMGIGNNGYPLIYPTADTIDNVDPMYFESKELTEESDIYSFGMVLFEVLCGKQTSTSEPLSILARHHYENGTLTEIIDPILRKQMSPISLDIFSAIAYQCLQRSREERPTILEVEKKIEEALEHQLVFEAEQKISFEYLKIPLKEIRLATNGFHDDHLIGWGGFGGVYKAELIHFDLRKYVRKNDSHEQSMVELFAYPRLKSKVAVKKLDSKYGQGKEQFLREIEVLSNLNHENIVSLVGFCDEDGEMILIYEYASNGSLDRHIGKIHKVYSHTWAQRLKICLDVAHGLNYLHNKGIIHRDIKSANILIGQNQESMIGDFGLSRNKKNTNEDFSITNVAGTLPYTDPKYARTGRLSKRSDIYSLGVVLLEVFCGRLAVPPQLGDDPEYLLHQAERHFQQKTFDKMIDPYLKQEFEKSCANSGDTSFSDSINTFVEITYKCLHTDEAPNLTTMEVVEELKKAWTFHVEEGGKIKPARNNFIKDQVVDFYRSFNFVSRYPRSFFRGFREAFGL